MAVKIWIIYYSSKSAASITVLIKSCLVLLSAHLAGVAGLRKVNIGMVFLTWRYRAVMA